MAGVVEVVVAHSVVRVEEHGQPLLDEAQQTLEVAACIDRWIDRYNAQTSAMECSMSLRAASSKPLPAPGVPRITPLMVPRALRSLSLTPHAHTHTHMYQAIKHRIAGLSSLLFHLFK